MIKFKGQNRRIIHLILFTASILIILLGKLSPAVHWIFSLSAFLIPVILIINFLLLIFFFRNRSKSFWLAFVVLVFGFNHFVATFGSFKFSQELKDNNRPSISILTHNLGSYSFSSSGKTRAYTSKIDLGQYDVICFQEFSKSDNDSTIQIFLKEADLADYHYFFTGTKMAPRDLGLLTLSKYPIVSTGKMPFGSNSYNGFSFVDIRVASEVIRVYNVHLNSYSLAEAHTAGYSLYRIKQAVIERAWRTELMINSINDCDYPVILSGDLNEHPYGYVYGELSRKLNDTFVQKLHPISYSYSNFPVRIDYIFHDDSFTTKNYEIQYKCEISDHFPVFSRVVLD